MIPAILERRDTTMTSTTSTTTTTTQRPTSTTEHHNTTTDDNGTTGCSRQMIMRNVIPNLIQGADDLLCPEPSNCDETDNCPCGEIETTPVQVPAPNTGNCTGCYNWGCPPTNNSGSTGSTGVPVTHLQPPRILCQV